MNNRERLDLKQGNPRDTYICMDMFKSMQLGSKLDNIQYKHVYSRIFTSFVHQILFIVFSKLHIFF